MSDTRSRHTLAGLLFIGLTTVGVGCSGRPEDTRDVVRIGYTPYLTMSPMVIAEAEGYFEEQGIDVELVTMRSAATSIPALSQGRMDVLPGPMSPSLFNAVSRGAGIRLVADKGSYLLEGCSSIAFVVSPQIAAMDTKILPRRIGWGREPFSTFRIERMLQHFGFDLEGVEHHSVPMAARYDAVSAGRLDAAQISEPFLGRFINEGGTIWVEPREVLPGHQYSVFAFGPRLLEEDRELGQRVTVALLKGIRAFNRGKTERNVDIMVDAIGWERALVEEACWPQMRADGGINIESIGEFQEWAFARGELDVIVPPSDYMDTTFVLHAREQLEGRRELGLHGSRTAPAALRPDRPQLSAG